jgi:hypothetical protein
LEWGGIFESLKHLAVERAIRCDAPRAHDGDRPPIANKRVPPPREVVIYEFTIHPLLVPESILESLGRKPLHLCLHVLDDALDDRRPAPIYDLPKRFMGIDRCLLLVNLVTLSSIREQKTLFG